MKNLVYALPFLLFIFSSFTCLPTGWPARLQQTVTTDLILDLRVTHPSGTARNDGSIELNVHGGKAPYTIQVISTFAPSQTYTQQHLTLKKLGSGMVTILVQDADKQVVQRIIELIPEQ